MKKKVSRLLLLVMVFNLVVGQGVFAGDYFKDQGDINSWAVESVIEGVDRGLVSGYKDGSFKPRKKITRAEFTKLVVNMMDLKEDGSPNKFSDVAKTDWFYDPVRLAAGQGIIEGSNGKFKPEASIKRQDMAVIIDRALGLDKMEDLKLEDFKDIDSWAVESINRVMAEGIMLGSNGKFRPKDKVTREMAATVVVRANKYREAQAGEEEPGEEVDKDLVARRLDRSLAYIGKEVKNPTVSTVAGEWSLIGLNRSGRPVDKKFNESYKKNLLEILEEKDGDLHPTRYTEYSRAILGLKSMGEDPRDFKGYDLVDRILDMDKVKKQGINGPIFALIALNSLDGNYELEKKAMVEYILEREIASGGWALSSEIDRGDVDVTAMAIQALAPLRDDKRVVEAIERGVDFLSREQESDGGYTSWASKNSENVSQVIIALSSLDIDPHRDERFVKSGRSLVDFLLDYQNSDGGFSHELTGRSNLMASEQGLLALVAYERMLKDESPLYDMRLEK